MGNKLLIFGVLVCMFHSCMINSTITDVHLIEEKGQKEYSGGLYGPIPGLNFTYSKGVTDKIAIQTSVNLSTFSGHVQQSVGVYKKKSERLTTELYGGLLGGYGIFTSFGGDSDSQGIYSIGFVQYNVGAKSLWNKNITYGFSLKPGIVFFDGYYSNIMVFNEKESWYDYYFAPMLFVKYNLSRARLGVFMQGQFLIAKDFSGYRGLMPNISFMYQYRKNTKEGVRQYYKEKAEIKQKKDSLISLKNELCLVSANPSYKYGEGESNPGMYVFSNSYAFIPIGMRFQRYLNYWFSLGAQCSYYKMEGTARNTSGSFSYIQDNFVFSVTPRLHYYKTKNIDLSFGFDYRDSDTQLRGKESKDNQYLYANGSTYFSDNSFAFIPFASKAYYKRVGLLFEYSFSGFSELFKASKATFGILYQL